MDARRAPRAASMAMRICCVLDAALASHLRLTSPTGQAHPCQWPVPRQHPTGIAYSTGRTRMFLMCRPVSSSTMTSTLKRTTCMPRCPSRSMRHLFLAQHKRRGRCNKASTYPLFSLHLDHMSLIFMAVLFFVRIICYFFSSVVFCVFQVVWIVFLFY